ncbi:hypothetical protein HMPREF0645_2410 [Hallella bergensis DSM 17361]|uniref:Uncharacterized protein n=1 Tax=Hallella bergensis DSM 17361 TaxID=585502 RepID=D1PZM5_9BACT|nr:hypothetical protein HMPREF0645_2410 [Hallella bergensis DSM 17361]
MEEREVKSKTKNTTNNMKHLLPARYMLTMLLACFMALGAQAQQKTEPPLELFVSAKTGND